MKKPTASPSETYAAPECRVILLSLEGNAMQTVSNEGRENDDDDIFG